MFWNFFPPTALFPFPNQGPGSYGKLWKNSCNVLLFLLLLSLFLTNLPISNQPILFSKKHTQTKQNKKHQRISQLTPSAFSHILKNDWNSIIHFLHSFYPLGAQKTLTSSIPIKNSQKKIENPYTKMKWLPLV